ncbi:MAG TPA: hypothetical protein PLL18_17315, partial [Flavobacteriales bacterium]|nr:hypothetical protein [Flavobacteriales bacterium]
QTFSFFYNGSKLNWPYTWNRPNTTFVNRLDWANDATANYNYDVTQENFYANRLVVWASNKAGNDPVTGL